MPSPLEMLPDLDAIKQAACDRMMDAAVAQVDIVIGDIGPEVTQKCSLSFDAWKHKERVYPADRFDHWCHQANHRGTDKKR